MLKTSLRSKCLASMTALALLGAGYAVAETKAPEPGTYGYLTGDENRKPVVNLTKTSKKSCKTCGTVSDINMVEDKAKGTGLGAIAGAVGGGLLGNQIGSGRGRTLGTIAGVAGGAVAGHEIERRVKDGKKHWDVQVTMDDKKTKHQIRFADEPKFASGERVTLTYAK